MDEILIAVNGTMDESQRDFLKMLLSHLEMIVAHLKEIDLAIKASIGRFDSAVSMLCSIGGVGTTASTSIIAEIGIDMSRFKTSEHICSWAGLSPGNNESAGKRKSVSVTKGNPYIKSMLCEIAWVIAGKRDMYLSRWYWRIKQKKGAKKAIIALARKLLVIIYTMLRNGTFFDENMFESRRLNAEKQRANRYIRKLEKLGYTIAPQQA
jgi:transposase